MLSYYGSGSTASCTVDWVNQTLLPCNYDVISDPCRRVCYWNYHIYPFFEIADERVSRIAYGRVYPFLMVVTILSNIIVIRVLARQNMRTNTNLILQLIAFADLMVGFLPFPFMLFFHGLRGSFVSRDETIKTHWCYLAKYTMDSLPPTFHNSAVWLTVLLALQRYSSIHSPIRGNSFWTYPRIKGFALIIFLTCLLFQIPKIVDVADFQVVNFEITDPALLTIEFALHKCIYRRSVLLSRIGPDTYYSVYLWCRVILFSLVPSVLLCWLSGLLILEIKRAKCRARRLIRCRRLRMQSYRISNTILLAAIVVIFLAVNLPMGMILCSVCIANTLDLPLDQEKLKLAAVTNNMLILATYPVNLAIYCGMSSEFRRNFRTSWGDSSVIRRRSRRSRTEYRTEYSAIRRIQQSTRLALMPVTRPNWENCSLQNGTNL